MPTEMVPFAVLPLVVLVQCVLLILSRRDARYWRQRYTTAVADQDSAIAQISKQRDEVLAGWNKTIDDYNRHIIAAKEFREMVERRLVGGAGNTLSS